MDGQRRLRASASSYVRFFRFFSSSLRCPGPKRGSNFWNCTSVAPNDWKLRVTLLLNPTIRETMAMTVATPITMPRMVRNERSLCPKTAVNAKRRFSTGLLIAQRLHRRQAGRLDGWEHAGDHAGQ